MYPSLSYVYLSLAGYMPQLRVSESQLRLSEPRYELRNVYSSLGFVYLSPSLRITVCSCKSVIGALRKVVLSRGIILVQVTIYRRLLIGRDGHLDQSEANDISKFVREYDP